LRRHPAYFDGWTAEDSALLTRARQWNTNWTDGEPDWEVALWADRLAQDVAAYCKRHRVKLAFRGPEVVKAITPYLDLHKVVDVVERVRALANQNANAHTRTRSLERA
jgi:hypothetical protein